MTTWLVIISSLESHVKVTLHESYLQDFCGGFITALGSVLAWLPGGMKLLLL